MNLQRRRSIRIMAWLVPLCLAGTLLAAGCSSTSPEQKIDKAKQALQKHDYHAAEVYLKSVLRKHEDDGQAWALLGRTSLVRGQYDDAINQFDKARTHGQPAAKLALPLARAQIADGQYKQALQTLNSDASESSDENRALLASLRGNAHLALGHTGKAAAHYKSALAIEPDFAAALRGQARLALKRDDLEGARSKLKQAVSAHPDDIPTLTLLGQVNYRAKRCDAVVEHLSHAMQLGSDSRHSRALLADCQLRTGGYEDAQDNIDKILAAQHNDPLGNYLQALMDIRQGQYQQAVNHMQVALNAAPGNLRSQTLIAWLYIAQGKPGKAQPFLTHVLDRAPTNAVALRLQAGLWMTQNKDDQVRSLLKKTAQNHPDDQNLHETMAAVRAALKRRQDQGNSGGEATDAVSLQLELAHALAKMGRDTIPAVQAVLSRIQPQTAADQRAVASSRISIALAIGATQEAIQRAEAFAKSRADDSKAQKLLAWTYIRAGRYDDAARVLARIHKAHPDDAAIVRVLAELNAHRGRYDQAIANLAPLHKAHPDDTGLTLKLAELYARAGKKSKGIELLQSATQRQPDSAKLKRALARAYLAKGQHDQGVSLIQKQLKIGDDQATWLYLQGVAQLQSDQTEAGLKSLAAAADKASGNSRLEFEVARAELAYDKTDAAIARLQKLRQQSPDFWPAAGLLAQALNSTGDTDAALDQAAALRHSGHGYIAAVLAGDILRQAKRFKQADAAYTKAYQQRPSKRLAMTLFDTRRAGHLAQPAEPLEKWLQHTPDDAATALRLASWYQHEDQSEKAAKLYKTILDAHPDAVAALNNLALITAQDDPQQALAYAQKAYAKAPDSAAVADTLGWLLVNQGQVDKGIGLLKKADQAAGDKVPEIRFHFAAALAKRGRSKDKTRVESLLHEALSAGLPDRDASHARATLQQLQPEAATGSEHG